MSEKYTFSISNDFPNHAVTTTALSSEIADSTIITALDYVGTDADICEIWFKASLSPADEVTLSGVVAAHQAPPAAEAPCMVDGRPIVRSDTRPLGTQTYFTMYGDSASGIGDGKALVWDFSNDDDLYNPADVENGVPIPDGYKIKRMDMSFNDPVYSKDGTIYFFDAPWGSYVIMYVTVPSGNYYPNDYGSIPAAALGLGGDQMYAYATKDVFYSCYVNKHHITGTCVFGDELNAEGSSVDAVPVGWYVTGLVFTLDTDNVSKGYGSFEIYRQRSVLLPGEDL